MSESEEKSINSVTPNVKFDKLYRTESNPDKGWPLGVPLHETGQKRSSSLHHRIVNSKGRDDEDRWWTHQQELEFKKADAEERSSLMYEIIRYYKQIKNIVWPDEETRAKITNKILNGTKLTPEDRRKLTNSRWKFLGFETKANGELLQVDKYGNQVEDGGFFVIKWKPLDQSVIPRHRPTAFSNVSIGGRRKTKRRSTTKKRKISIKKRKYTKKRKSIKRK